MTNQNNAAEAAEKAIRAAITLLDGDLDHENAEAMRALLSKLRAEGVQTGDERESFIAWLTGSYPNAYSEPEAVRLWHHKHVSALAWQRRAALASAPVADDVADVHSLTGETGYTGVGTVAPVAEQQQWRIRVAGPAGHERMESFSGSSLDEACAAARMQGFVCCQDEDGNVIVEVQHSAPVAGEAQPAIILKAVDEYGPQLDWTKHWVEYPTGTKFYAAPQASACRPLSDQDMDLVAGWLGKHEAGDIGFHGLCERIIQTFATEAVAAAPQASEAVRNAALEEAAIECESWLMAKTRSDLENMANQTMERMARHIRALKSQADKDGGDCAKGAGDERAEFEAWAVGILGDNPTWRESAPCELAWQAWTESRAAQHPRTDGGGHG